jgi:hypothetical protein
MLPVVQGVVDRDFPQAQFVLKPQALQTREFRALGMSDGSGSIHPAGEFQKQTAPTLTFIARQPFRHIVRNIQGHLHGRRLPQLPLPRNYLFISLVPDAGGLIACQGDSMGSKIPMSKGGLGGGGMRRISPVDSTGEDACFP